MNHFVTDDKMNIFRLPVGWQYLANNNLGSTLDSGNLANYDQLVQGCLSSGASCIIDVSLLCPAGSWLFSLTKFARFITVICSCHH